MCFAPRERGRFTASHIKFLRLSFAGTSAKLLAQVQGSDALVETLAPQVAAMTQSHLA
jgi:hypothetical protein